MEPREVVYGLCLCGGLALAGHVHILGVMTLVSLATVLLLRCQFTCRLMVGDRVEEFADECDADEGDAPETGLRGEPLRAVRRTGPDGMMEAQRRRLG